MLYEISIMEAFRKQFWPLFLDGSLKVIIDCSFALADAQAAHEYVADNKNVGKVILLVSK